MHKHNKTGQVMSKQEFLRHGAWAKEEYEGLLVSSDGQQGCYNIGVQLAEDRVLVVDQAHEDDVHERYHSWVPKVQEIQRTHRVHNNSGNYAQ